MCGCGRRQQNRATWAYLLDASVGITCGFADLPLVASTASAGAFSGSDICRWTCNASRREGRTLLLVYDPTAFRSYDECQANAAMDRFVVFQHVQGS